MADFDAAQMKKLAEATTPDPGFVDGSVRVFAETVTYASQATSDTIAVARLPKGAIFLYGLLTATVTAGTATMAIGTAASAGKYRAAATFTATNAPTPFGLAANQHVALAAEEEVIITVGTAALPASGTLQVTIFYAFN